MDIKTQAALAVVQPGTRTGFQRRAMDAMRSIVTADAAFAFLGTDDARAGDLGLRALGPRTFPPSVPAAQRLSACFGYDPKHVVSAHQRVYFTSELYGPDEHASVPFFRDNSLAAGLPEGAIVFAHEAGVLFGVFGLERKSGTFSTEERNALEELAIFLVAGARAQLAYEDLAREVACLRALSKKRGTLFVVDRDSKRVIWAANRHRGIDWREDVLAHETLVVNGLEATIEAKAHGAALPTPPRIGPEVVYAASRLENEPVFGNIRGGVLSTEPADEAHPTLLASLSKREREIARLLIAGYSGVNVAAIAGLSENTVRTYVRRLYGKLEVSNRADLVRKLMTPQPASSGTNTPRPLPPDSALAYGDDTLD
jgi:DNA-binding CsgD family transcriptional regulator